MLRSTKYQRLSYKLGLSLRSVNPVSGTVVLPTWYGNNTKGFSIGGAGGSPNVAVVTADKATFSTETTAAQTSANLGGERFKISSGGNETHAYYIGGCNNSDVSQTTGYKLTYSNDTTVANTSVNFPAARSDIYMAVYTTAGYSYGGSTSANSNDQTAAYKTPFTTDTTAALTSANLSTGRASGTTLSSDTAAMYLGGFRNTPGFFTAQTIADKMPFSTETTAVNSSLTLPTARGYMNGGSINGPLNSRGYLAPSSGTNTFSKVLYSTDTTSNLAATGIQSSSGMATTSAGYTLGGGTALVTAYKMNISNDTVSTVAGMNKSIGKYLAGGCS
jgi:hypothetical protein